VRINGFIVTVEQADDRRVQQLRFSRVAERTRASDDATSEK
jgi:hypothetical protein